MLYHVDDLKAQAESNLAGRRTKVDSALEIIERETARCLDQLRHQRHAGTLLRQIGDYADSVRLSEQEALFARCSGLNDADRAAIAHALQRLQNRFLHHPRAALRSAASEAAGPDPHPILNAVRRLFGLDVDDSSPPPLHSREVR
jgi:glutamyl-tRNA reductase